MHDLSTGQFELPSSPPKPGPARNVAYPDVAERRLSNGLRLAVIEDHRLPRVSLWLGLGCGRTGNLQEQLALASLSLEMLPEGTRRHDSRGLAELIDQNAIDFNSEVLLEYSQVGMTVLEPLLPQAFQILGELLMEPVFPANELDKVKVRWKSGLISQRSQPSFLARERTFETLFAGHPYRRVTVPLDDLKAAERAELEQFYQVQMRPSAKHLVVAGPVSAAVVESLILDNLGGAEFGRSGAALPPVPSWRGREVHLVNRPHSVQSRIVVTGPAPARLHPEILLFRMTNQVFGGSASSRLFLNLREDKGFTYGAYSAYRSYQAAGMYMASADVNADVTAEAINETLAEIGRVRQEPPSSEELSRSKAEIIGTFIRQMETASSVCGLELYRRMSNLADDYYQQLIPRISSVTAAQVVECAERYLQPDRCLITVVGDADVLEPQLRQFGAVTVHAAQSPSES